jgi:hypothetical protein
MKDELNTDLLNKMGWVNYSISRGVGFINIFYGDKDVILFFTEGDKIWVVKKTQSDHYLFISVTNVLEKDPKFKTVKFLSNLDLFMLIKQNMACNKKYKRLLKLIKLEI